MAEKNPLEMSDEEFLNSSPPVAAPKSEPKPEPKAEEPPQNEPEPTPEPETPDPEPENTETTDEPPEGSVAPKEEPPAEEVPAEPKKAEAPVEEKDTPKPETPDYQKFYQQVMQPIKANGKTIELKTPEEAIRLMQMGAGFTKKLQDLQPVLKTVRMLEKADLLNEDKLAYLIDIHNKNPEAIKKLIKESGIDPLDLNPDDKVSYTPGNHSVSDAEMAFNEALSEVQSREGGQDTIQTINQTWDQKSVQLVWENPDILGVIQSQREQGIYSIISAEIDRQKSLGHIPPSTPFLHAYKSVGDALTAAGAFNHLNQQAQQAPLKATPPTPAQSQEAQKPQPQVIATRTAQPKAQVKNGDKAQAAAPTSSTRGKAAPVVNPLAMADDEFLKQFQGRL